MEFISNEEIEVIYALEYVFDEISQEFSKRYTRKLLVNEKFNYEMIFMRPPKGEFNERTLAKTDSLGFKTVMWSLAYDDWDENKQDREEYGKTRDRYRFIYF